MSKDQKPLLSDRNYSLLRQTVIIGLPALGTLYFALAQIWGLPFGEAVVGTIAAVNVFAGAILNHVKAVYDRSDVKYDGYFSYGEYEDGTALRLTSVDYEAMNNKSELIFKVKE